MDKKSELLHTLKEYNNPLVIILTGTIIGTTFYFKETSFIILFGTFIIVSLLVFIQQKYLILAVSILFGYIYSYLCMEIFTGNLNYLLNKKNIFIGEIASNPDNNSWLEKKYTLHVKAIFKFKTHVNFKAQVQGSTYEEYEIGDLVQITGVLKQPRSSFLPGFFDEKRFLLTRGIRYIIKAEKSSLVFLDEPKETIFRKKINELRNKILTSNIKNIKEDNLNLINGIIFGSKASKLNIDLREKIRDLGLAHIVSASGFNVSILACGTFFLLQFIYKRNLLTTFITIFFIFIYSAIADFSNSIIRASAFTILVLIGSTFNKKIKILPGISLIVLFFFLLSPVNLLDIGLQLSFVAFLGLILFFNEIKNTLLPKLPKYFHYIILIFLQSLIAQIFVMPLIIFYFHNIQVLSLISNLIAVPLASCILMLGIINSIIIFIPIINNLSFILSYPLNFFSSLFLSWIELLNNFPLKNIFIPNLNFYFLPIVYVFIVLLIIIVFLPSVRIKTSIMLLLFILIVCISNIFIAKENYIKIFFIKKYNQDLILIILPYSRSYLLATKYDENDIKKIKEYLRLNSIKSEINLLSNTQIVKEVNNEEIFKNTKNYTSIRYKDFTLEIIKNYKDTMISEPFCTKLPILKKDDPMLKDLIKEQPNCLIVNDYKKLSKRAYQNIKFLKSLNSKIYFLSETGTILVTSNGKKHFIKTDEKL